VVREEATSEYPWEESIPMAIAIPTPSAEAAYGYVNEYEYGEEPMGFVGSSTSNVWAPDAL
jgi:hypothetical protein